MHFVSLSKVLIGWISWIMSWSSNHRDLTKRETVHVLSCSVQLSTSRMPVSLITLLFSSSLFFFFTFQLLFLWHFSSQPTSQEKPEWHVSVPIFLFHLRLDVWNLISSACPYSRKATILHSGCALFNRKNLQLHHPYGVIYLLQHWYNSFCRD